MNQTTMVALISQAELVSEDEQLGVSSPAGTIWSRDALQAALLKVIAQKPQSVKELKELLLRVRDGPTREEDAALILVDFILAFDKVLEK